jgi:uncharacterized protein YciI
VRKIIALFCFLLALQNAPAQDSTKHPIDLSKMKNYFMVFLYRVDDRPALPDAEVAKIQEAHLENITRLALEGKIVLAGPFTDDGNLRGIFIFDVETQDEVERLCKTDAAIKNGRLRYEIKPWFGPKSLLKVNEAFK